MLGHLYRVEVDLIITSFEEVSYYQTTCLIKLRKNRLIITSFEEVSYYGGSATHCLRTVKKHSSESLASRRLGLEPKPRIFSQLTLPQHASGYGVAVHHLAARGSHFTKVAMLHAQQLRRSLRHDWLFLNRIALEVDACD